MVEVQSLHTVIKKYGHIYSVASCAKQKIIGRSLIYVQLQGLA